MAKGEDLVKYITEQVVQYIDTPREQRLEDKRRQSEARPDWRSRWFGMLPMSLGMLLGRRGGRKRGK